jgi:hypothetical protein
LRQKSKGDWIMQKNISRCYQTTETQRQLNVAFESRLPEISSSIDRIAGHDCDLKQEALLGVCNALKIDPQAPRNYLLNNARWNLLNSKQRGVSVDSERRKSEGFMLFKFEDYKYQDVLMSEIELRNKRDSVESIALYNICLEKFIDLLTPIELEFVRLKAVVDLAEYKVVEILGIKRLTLHSLRRTLRKKFDLAFGV